MAGIFNEFTEKVGQYKALVYAVKENAQPMADLLLEAGLRNLRPSQLDRMKRELAKYNLHTMTWKK